MQCPLRKQTTKDNATLGDSSASDLDNSEEVSCVTKLHNLVTALFGQDEENHDIRHEHWTQVRTLLQSLIHTDDDTGESFQESMEIKAGEPFMPFLHACCMNHPPADVVALILKEFPGAAKLTTRTGTLPLHVASTFRSSEEVIHLLVDAYPEAIFHQDERKRVPLHYALEPRLTESRAQSLDLDFSNQSQKCPLSFAIPELVQPICHTSIVTLKDKDGMSPLDLFSVGLSHMDDKLRRDNARAVITLILNTRPEGTMRFMASIQAFPRWILEHVMRHYHVMDLLQEKASHPMFSTFCLLDFVFQTLLIVAFITGFRHMAQHEHSGRSRVEIYVGSFYFACRAVTKLAAFVKVGRVDLWVHDYWNWVEIGDIALLLTSTILLQSDADVLAKYRGVLILTGGLQWINMISLLRILSVHFSVFVSGVIHILVDLVPFIVMTFLLLGSFAFMYYATNFDSTTCQDERATGGLMENGITYCTVWGSLLWVYSQLVGQLSNDHFTENRISLVLSVVFSFLLIVTQLNVIIAVITESYANVQNRGEVVFWTDKFYHLASLEPIKRSLGCQDSRDAFYRAYNKFTEQSRERWHNYMLVLSLKRNDYVALKGGSVFMITSSNRGSPAVLRKTASGGSCIMGKKLFTVIVVFVWWVVGLVSLGWLWPPQVREWLFTKRKLGRREEELDGGVGEDEEKDEDKAQGSPWGVPKELVRSENTAGLAESIPSRIELKLESLEQTQNQTSLEMERKMISMEHQMTQLHEMVTKLVEKMEDS